MSVMAETSQSAMGPYVAIAAIGLASYAWTAVFRVAVSVKVAGANGDSGGEGEGDGGGDGGGGNDGLSRPPEVPCRVERKACDVGREGVERRHSASGMHREGPTQGCGGAGHARSARRTWRSCSGRPWSCRS